MSAERSLPGEASLWIDVSTLLRYKGTVTGIPRTVSQLVEALSKQEGLRLRLCSLSFWFRTFKEVPPQAVRTAASPHVADAARFAVPPATGKYVRGRLAFLARLLPDDVRRFLRETAAATNRLARFLGRCGLDLLAKVVRGAAGAATRGLTGRASPVLFADGDVLFIPGSSWDDAGALEELARIKQARRLFVVPIIYDVIPEKLPHTCNPLQPPLFGPWIRKLLRLSDLVLTISQHSRRELLALVEKMGFPPPPVEVIRLGDAPAGLDRPVRPVCLPHQTGAFALSVGTLEIRKNHWLLYQVWRRLVEQLGPCIPPLVLAGRAGWGSTDLLQQIQDDPLTRGRIIVLSAVADKELAWLYRNCLFTLYPSHYEGWGLPVAESMAHGKHCICSNASSLPEVGGDLVDYHDPLDALRCLQLIRLALFEPEYLHQREARIRNEFRCVSWRECAPRIVALLERRLRVRLGGAAGEAAASNEAA